MSLSEQVLWKIIEDIGRHLTFCDKLMRHLTTGTSHAQRRPGNHRSRSQLSKSADFLVSIQRIQAKLGTQEDKNVVKCKMHMVQYERLRNFFNFEKMIQSC